MKVLFAPRREAIAGLTLLEVMVSMSILGVVSYTLLRATRMGSDSQQAVQRTVSDNVAMRDACCTIRNELRVTSDPILAIDVLPDGNHQVTFMQPIVVGGNPDWGVYDPLQGPDEAARNLKDWSVRYTVDAVPGGPFGLNRRLLRQVLDDTGVVQREDVLMEGLRDGGVDPPGFTVVQAGDMWEITLTTVGYIAGSRGRGTVFHVQTRN